MDAPRKRAGVEATCLLGECLVNLALVQAMLGAVEL
jgi:hypothetical protein